MADETPTPTASEIPPSAAPPAPAAGAPSGVSAGAPKKLKRPSAWEVYWPGDPRVERESIPIASFPMIIYFWPTMLAFLVCGTLQGLGVAPGTLGWVALATFGFNLMVIVTDLDQKKFLIALLGVALLGLLAWITTLKDLGVVTWTTAQLSGLDVRWSTHAYFLLFFLLAFFFLIGMLQPRFDFWRLEHNEFVHYVQPWGRDQSIPRQGSTVTREVPDILELLLTFGGGTLVIRREGEAVARIEHVPFLGRRMVAIERMLGVTRVKNV